jgi:hypothetical protein
VGLTVDPPAGLGELDDPRVLGQGAALVTQLVGTRVKVLQVQQPHLG